MQVLRTKDEVLENLHAYALATCKLAAVSPPVGSTMFNAVHKAFVTVTLVGGRPASDAATDDSHGSDLVGNPGVLHHVSGSTALVGAANRPRLAGIKHRAVCCHTPAGLG